MVWPATQRPDANSIPPPISSSAVIRFALMVTGHTENDMVLGAGRYKAGIRATQFSRDDVGIGLLAGEGADPQIVRCAYVDTAQADRIALRARTARAAAGLLTGYADDDDLDTTTDDGHFLEDAAEIWPRDDNGRPETGIHGERLAELLAAHSSRYEGWTKDNALAAARAAKIPVKQIKVRGVNRNGIKRADLDKAVTDRNAGLTDTDDNDAGNDSDGGEPSG
jgi:S-DNA-T family DNA segregation ATPase FtsK/SpoIIIE